jgi:hypothetical protein
MIVFHHFTWQQFGMAAIGFILIWYAIVLLLYFRKEIKAFLSRPPGGKTDRLIPKEDTGVLQHVWERDGFMDDDLVGDAAEPEGVSTHSWNSFGFTGKTKQKTEDELLGLIPDALEEIKTALHTVETSGGGKAEFISLFKLVSAKYGRLKNSPHLGAINEWILDNTPFELTEDELWQLWE